MLKGITQLFSRKKAVVAQIQKIPAFESEVLALKEQGNQSLASGNVADAIACYQRVAQLTPQDAAAFISLGYAQFELELLEAARLNFEHALAIDPKHVDANFLLGSLLLRQGLSKQATQCFEATLALSPNFEPALMELARLQEGASDFESALAAYNRIISNHSPNCDARIGQVKMFLALERWQDALDAVLSHVKADESHMLRVYQALAMQRLKRNDEASVIVDQVLQQQPNNVEALQVKATILSALGQYQAALPIYQLAIAINPHFASAMSDAGAIYAKQGDFDQALSLYARAIEAQPDHADALYNYSTAFLHMGQCQEAIAMADRGLACCPNHADMHWVKAAALLRSGDFEQGWKEYEWRWQAKLLGSSAAKPRYAQPMWTGEPVNGKTILLHAEQGLGDTIQLLRYVPILAAKGATVLLNVPEAIVQLCQSLKQYCTVLQPFQLMPTFDYHCPLFSLPLAFKTSLNNIPCQVPYLAHEPALQAEWERRLGSRAAPRVGLVWSGNAAFQNDEKRSVALATLLSALPNSCRYISLQKEVRDSDHDALAHSSLYDASQNIKTFADTAALITCMDLVISVDTSVAHLAGALAKPLWIMLPYSPDWRWMMQREDSPWYSTAKLFRQDAERSWLPVLKRISEELNRL